MLIQKPTRAQQFSANEGAYDTTRIYHAMDKARNGGNFTVGVLGGSITAGYAASTESKRWANLVTSWWKTKFPDANITLVNAGIGGTGSNIGTFRVKEDLLSKKPDFIVVEFAVNDSLSATSTKMMEGVIRQILSDENHPGLMMLMLKMDNGTTAQAFHKPVGNHYKVPMVSFADLVDAQCAADGRTLSSIFVDGLHPNDVGMGYIAKFINAELDTIYNHLPASENIPAINTELPEPLISDVFASTYRFNPANIVPLSNKGWTIKGATWETETAGAELVFQLDGNATAVQYYRHNWNNAGQAEVWVDNGVHHTLEAYWDQTWGPATLFDLVGENLPDGPHELHIKIKDTSTSPTQGHYFSLKNVMKAGHIGSAAPIAQIVDPFCKTVKNHVVALDGSASFDPDGNTVASYLWTIEKAPAGSAAAIVNANAVQASFTPDVAGSYIISLAVGDGVLSSVKANKYMNVLDNNQLPVANAGADGKGPLDKYFTFDGSQSSDPEGQPLLYQWELISKPAQSEAILIKETTVNAKIKPDVAGFYKVALVVSDSIDASVADTVTLEAIDGYNGIKTGDNRFPVFEIFPNPATDSFMVNFTVNQPKQVSIGLYNTDGQLVFEKDRFLACEGLNKFQIVNQSLNKGNYLVRISDGIHASVQKLIIE